MKKRRLIILIIGFVLLLFSPLIVFADSPKLISTPEELQNMRNNPSGSYVLSEDLDMAGFAWEPFEFSGSLDGEDHCILNLTIPDSIGSHETVYDANLKTYDGYCVGMFTSLKNAEIKNVQLLGVSLECEEKGNTFAGMLAGFAINTNVSCCTFEGDVSVVSGQPCNGAAGIFGFANNVYVSSCGVETVLCFTDTNIEYKDEQFLGAVYSFGYGSIEDCNVSLYAYDADHGYVHNGGLIGTFMYYDYENFGSVTINNNTVTGIITFFEDNIDRRAYCDPIAGEVMHWDFQMYDNDGSAFTGNEIFDYDSDMAAHSGCSGHLTEMKAASRTGRAGYTLEICDTCGYINKKDYTLPLEGASINPNHKSWQKPYEGCTDLLLFTTHADDEQLFFAGLLPYYSQVRDLNVQVVYVTDHLWETVRHDERKNGLWGVGITHEPDHSGWLDQYSETYEWAMDNYLSSDNLTEDDIIEWFRQTIEKYKPQVIVSHDINGEYSHGQHMVTAGCLKKCLEKYGEDFSFLKKAYLHLWGENTIRVDLIDKRFAELNGLSPFQITQKYGFPEHNTQWYTWFTNWLYGNSVNLDYGFYMGMYCDITQASQISTYSPLSFGLIFGDPSLDSNGNDLFEGVKSYRQQEEEQKAEEARLAEEERIRLEQEAAEKLRKENQKKLIIRCVCGFVLLLIITILVLRAVNKAKKKKRRRKKKK